MILENYKLIVTRCFQSERQRPIPIPKRVHSLLYIMMSSSSMNTCEAMSDAFAWAYAAVTNVAIGEAWPRASLMAFVRARRAPTWPVTTIALHTAATER